MTGFRRPGNSVHNCGRGGGGGGEWAVGVGGESGRRGGGGGRVEEGSGCGVTEIVDGFRSCGEEVGTWCEMGWGWGGGCLYNWGGVCKMSGKE